MFKSLIVDANQWKFPIAERDYYKQLSIINYAKS